MIFDADGDGDLDLAVSTNAAFPSAPIYQIELFDNQTFDVIGSPYCSGFVPNSTGVAGTLTAFGSTRLDLNRVELIASSLPVDSFGFIIVSETQFLTPSFPITICVGGSIGRFVGPGEIQQSDMAGTFRLAVDVANFPQPQGFVAVQPGETWNFQAWHRDQGTFGLASNLTAPVSITF